MIKKRKYMSMVDMLASEDMLLMVDYAKKHKVAIMIDRQRKRRLWPGWTALVAVIFALSLVVYGFNLMLMAERVKSIKLRLDRVEAVQEAQIDAVDLLEDSLEVNLHQKGGNNADNR